MKQSRTKLSQLISRQALSGQLDSQSVEKIAAYLLSERRTNELDSIMRDVQASWAEAGYVEVLASSDHELSEGLKQKITQEVRKIHPTAKKIIITEVPDPSIIGGVRLNLADRQLDLSIEAKLNKFKQLVTT